MQEATYLPLIHELFPRRSHLNRSIWLGLRWDIPNTTGCFPQPHWYDAPGCKKIASQGGLLSCPVSPLEGATGPLRYSLRGRSEPGGASRGLCQAGFLKTKWPNSGVLMVSWRGTHARWTD